MDFTREPIIETVITPREGYRLVVRSSKSAAQEEHFVDALEVISFGNALFFRSLERPKPFIVPVADYEVLEVREPRMVLKTPVQEKAGPTREREQQPRQKIEPEKKEAPIPREEAPVAEEGVATLQAGEGRNDRRRERRRPFRRRRGQGRDEATPETTPVEAAGEKMQQPELAKAGAESELPPENILTTVPLLPSILPPPTSLIRDDIPRLQESFKAAFFIREDKEGLPNDDDALLEGLRSSSEFGDQEVSQQEPFCEPFFEESTSQVLSEDIPEDTKDLRGKE